MTLFRAENGRMANNRTKATAERTEEYMKRAFLIILDSFGIGAMEDAVSYGDVDVNTLRTL